MKRASVRSCNVCEQTAAGPLRLWTFAADSAKFDPVQEITADQTGLFPPKIVANDWRALFHKRLNIAWLSGDHVFLRVLQLPKAELAEIHSMVELQLEKVSPLPVHQILWSYELVPHPDETMQTVVVLIAARDTTEEQLGRFEAAGYFPDRLELPELHSLIAPPALEDGVWIYTASDPARQLILATWWAHNTLQHIQLFHLAHTETRGPALVDELTKTAWAAEVEGWLSGPAKVHVVATEQEAKLLQEPLAQWSNQPIQRFEPLPKNTLAQTAARRAAFGESTANLLPQEYALRYRQNFVDRLWMRGAFALLLVYTVVVLGYIAFLQFQKYDQRRVEQRLASISNTYTNALELREHVQVLQNQINLKYAALDSLKVAAELLPPDLTLTWLRFSDGERLFVQGTALPSKESVVQDYNAAMRNALVNGVPLFSNVEPPKIYYRHGPTGPLTWDFTSQINRPDLE